MKTIPHSDDIEMLFLASCLAKYEALDKVADKTGEEHFYDRAHAVLWKKIKSQFIQGLDCSASSISALYNKEEQQQAVLEIVRIAKPSVIEDTWKTLNDLWLKRELSWQLEEELDKIGEGEDKADTIIDSLSKKMLSLSTQEVGKGPSLDGWSRAQKEIEFAMRSGGVIGMSTGFKSIDHIIGGLGNSDLIILAGRPAMGKTSLALAMADYACQQAPCAFFSLEMSNEQLCMRRASMHSGVSVTSMREGRITPEQLKSLVGLRMPGQLYIDDSPNITPETMLLRARRLKQQNNIGLIVVDYLQLMDTQTNYQAQSVARVTEISKKLKGIAKELNIPVLALSQLSRSVESRQDKRPVLSDLRESGSIEQDADSVLFCYRDEYYLENTEPRRFEKETEEGFARRVVDYHNALEASKGKADIIVSKNRHGKIGTARLEFNASLTQFKEIQT